MTKLFVAVSFILTATVSAAAQVQPGPCREILPGGSLGPVGPCHASSSSRSSGSTTGSSLTPNQSQANAFNANGNHYSELGDWALAIDWYWRAYKLWPQKQVIRHNLADAYNDAGRAAYDSKDWVKAANYFSVAVKTWPKSDVYRRNLGMSQAWLGYEAFNRGDWDTAISLTREALKNIPSDDPWVESLRKRLQDATQNREAAKFGKAVAVPSDNERRPDGAEAEKQRQRNDAATAEEMKETIRQVSTSVVSTPATSTSGLEFKEMNAPTKDTGGNSKNTSNLSFGDSPAADKQLKSAATSDDPRKPFDDHGNSSGGLDFMTVDARQSGQQNPKPLPARLLNNPEYKKLQARKDELNKHFVELDARLQTIRKQQSSGQGNQNALAQEISDIKNQQSVIHFEQVQTDAKIQKMENDSVSFTEEPATPKDEKPAKPKGEKPPPK